MKRKTYALLALLLLAVLLIACGAAATMAPEVEKGAAPPGVDTDMAEAPREAQSGEGYASASELVAGQTIERMVIRTAQLSLIVEDVELTLPQVNAMVERMEGYIVQSSSYRTYSDRLAATVTLRVPAERFEEALTALHALAYKVQSETTSGEDVTDQYVNLEARLTALEATETELLALLAEVRQSQGNAEEKAQAILSIYNQLTNVRTQIEQIQGQMNYLSQMAALATITVELQPREPEITQPVVEEGYDPGRTISRAARSLVQVLQALLNAVIWFVVVLLPILLLIAVPVLLVVWLIRRGKKGKGQGAGGK